MSGETEVSAESEMRAVLLASTAKTWRDFRINPIAGLTFPSALTFLIVETRLASSRSLRLRRNRDSRRYFRKPN